MRSSAATAICRSSADRIAETFTRSVIRQLSCGKSTLVIAPQSLPPVPWRKV
jgi:hypothetical protein